MLFKKKLKKTVVLKFSNSGKRIAWDEKLPLPKNGEYVWLDVFTQGVVEKVSHYIDFDNIEGYQCVIRITEK